MNKAVLSTDTVARDTTTLAKERDVKPKVTCRGRNRPIMTRQRSVSVSPDRIVRFTRTAHSEKPTNLRRSLSEIGKSKHVDEHYKGLAPRSRSLDIDLEERSADASSRKDFSVSNPPQYHYHRSECEQVKSRSPSLSRSISLTRPIAWFRKRWLFHQLSDSGVLLGDLTSTMHQERKMTRSSSVADVDIKPPSPKSSNESRRNKHQKMGPHPKKKMLRSHSESAIDMKILQSLMKHSSTAPIDENKPAGIICSNEDFKKIITDSKRHRFGRKRNNTMVTQLETTPEAPAETEIHLDNRLSEKEESSTVKDNVSVAQERRGSRDRVIKLPMRQCASDPNSPAHLSEARRDIMRLSPLMLHKNNVNNSSMNINRTVHLSPKALTSRLTKCNANAEELEPMLPKDNNGNHLIEKMQLVDDVVIEEEEEEENVDEEKESSEGEQQIENTQTNNANDNESTKKPESAFDAQLLGEAIERHLAMQKSPGRKSPRYGEGRKRSGSLKNMLVQNNSQISARLGSLISRFPFRREGSVSPTNSENGVTV